MGFGSCHSVMRGEKTGAGWPAAGLDSGMVSKPGSSISPRRKRLRGMGACMGACLVVGLAGFIVTHAKFPDKREFSSLRFVAAVRTLQYE